MALIPMVDDFNAKVNNKAYDGFMIVVMAFMTLILWLAVVLLFPLPSVALKNQRRWGDENMKEEEKREGERAIGAFWNVFVDPFVFKKNEKCIMRFLILILNHL